MMNIWHISYSYHVIWQWYWDTNSKTNPESQQKRWNFWENPHSTCPLTTKEIMIFGKNLKHHRIWWKSAAVTIHGYGMLAEWRDPGLCRLLWNTNHQGKGTQDIHKYRLLDFYVENGMGHENAVLESSIITTTTTTTTTTVFVIIIIIIYYTLAHSLFL